MSTPPKAKDTEEDGGSDAIHVSARRVIDGSGMEDSTSHSKGKNRQLGDRLARDPIEGGRR